MTLAPPSQTRILHAALAELGSTDRPSSIDDSTSNTARRAKALWPDVLRGLLSLHPWNFAIRRRELNRAGDAPVFGRANAYQLPEDCVRWLPFGQDDTDWRAAEREGNYLLSNADAPLACRYIAYEDDVTRWPPMFVRAMTLALAESMAEGVTQSESIKEKLGERAEAALRKAKRMDGLESGETRRAGIAPRRDGWVARMNRGLDPGCR